MSHRKNITEIALNFYSGGIILLHPKYIENIKEMPTATVELANDCHIYFIVKRPRVTFVPDSVMAVDGWTIGSFRYVKDGIAKEINFWLQGEANSGVIKINDYPHTTLSLIKNGKKVFTVPAYLLSMISDHIEDSSIRDLEVVYVGMSYADGNRSAKDRLLSHSTLQQVLADLNNDAPDMEALIIMAQYDPPQVLISFDGRDKTLKVEDDRDAAADLQKQQAQITKDLQIALIEASLIRYFQPPYNDKYKQRFPHPTQKILKEVYEIDFGALTVEINTEEINGRLFSMSRNPGYHHIASVDLHDPAIRRSFFNFMNISEGPNATDLSGPLF